jgi:hypothetical protein
MPLAAAPYRARVSPLALFGRDRRVGECLLLREERKSGLRGPISVFDPERTFLDLYQSRTAAFHKLLPVSQCEGGLKAPFMKPQHDEPASGPEKPSKPSRTEEARRIVEEYADDLREILKKFRKLFN